MLEVVELNIDELQDNPLSANREDDFVFSRLKKEMERYGLLDLPVVLRANGGYRILSGHHRVRAWKALGHDSIQCLVVQKDMTKEEEFNLVNNLNTVRGEVTKGQLVRKIHEHKLDPTQLDVFRFPTSTLIPEWTIEDTTREDEDRLRKAKIAELTLYVASQIAQTMVDEKDELVTVLVVKDRAAAVIRTPFKQGSEARARADDLKRKLMTLLSEDE